MVEFRTSDVYLSELTSLFAGVHFKYQRLNGFWGIDNWNKIELRAGVYNQSTGRTAQIISIGTGYSIK